jgi:hypothetical protein
MKDTINFKKRLSKFKPAITQSVVFILMVTHPCSNISINIDAQFFNAQPAKIEEVKSEQSDNNSKVI